MLRKVTEQQILDSVHNLPVLAAVVGSGLKLMSDPNCSVRELTELLAKDQSISVRIIRIANSAFYGYTRQIKTLSEAIVILGFNKIRSLLITASVSNHLGGEVEGYMIAKGGLWKHSYAVAFASGLIAKMSHVADPDEAFTAGILHDIGKLILGNHLKGSYNKIMEIAKDNKTNLAVAEEQVLGMHHASVGGMILEHWNFPDTMATAVSKHHQPLESDSNGKLVGILCLADCWVRKMGFGATVEILEDDNEKLLEQKFNIDSDIKEKVRVYLKDEMVKMRELFPEDKSEVELAHLKN